MKILMFINGLYEGGKERQLIELIKQLLLEKNINLELAIMNKNIYYKEILDLNLPIHFLIRKIKKDPIIFLKLYKLCRRFNPDIIHTWDPMTSFYAAPITKLLNIKFVNGSIRNASKRLSKNIFLKYITVFPADIIISNSKAGLKSYKSKGIVIHNGFDFKRIQNLDYKETIRKKFKITTPYVIGMVASFSKTKDYTTYIKSAETILKKRNDVTFLAIGEGNNLNKYKQLVQNNPKIIFLGPQTNVESIINIFDIGILSTYTEGISNSIMEYMALGKPVIATNGGGTKELVVEGKTGFLVKPSSSEEIVEKILYFLDHKEIGEQMGAEGQKRIQEEFNIEKMTNSFLKIYNKLVNKEIIIKN